jgi:hypothetical protein
MTMTQLVIIGYLTGLLIGMVLIWPFLRVAGEADERADAMLRTMRIEKQKGRAK